MSLSPHPQYQPLSTHPVQPIHLSLRRMFIVHRFSPQQSKQSSVLALFVLVQARQYLPQSLILWPAIISSSHGSLGETGVQLFHATSCVTNTDYINHVLLTLSYSYRKFACTSQMLKPTMQSPTLLNLMSVCSN
jgi:hypothetical protein